MIIVSQNKDTIINYDNILALSVSGKYIQAHPANGGHAISLGVYETDERALEVFRDMIDERICLKMPEE